MATAPGVSSFQHTALPSSISSYLSEKYTTLKENLPGVYKVQKITLNVLAGLSTTASLAVGAAAIVGAVTFPAGLSALLVLLAVAGIFILLSRNIVDYNDPTTLEELRRQANSSTFDQLVKRHSLKMMLKYSIPAEARFKEIVKEKIQTLSFKEARKFHIKLMRSLDGYSSIQSFPASDAIKSLIDWNAKWREETRGVASSTILERYSIELLENTPGFNAAELAFLRDAKPRIDHAWSEYNRKMKELASSFEAQIKPHQQQLERALAQSDESYVAKWDPERLTTIQAEYDGEIREIDANTKSLLSQLQRGVEAIDRRLRDRALSNPLKADLLTRKKSFITQKAAAVQNAERLKLEALGRFTEKRRVCAIDIQSADAVRQREYETAQAEFSRQSAVINQQRDQSIVNYKAEHTFAKREIDEAYQRLISS